MRDFYSKGGESRIESVLHDTITEMKEYVKTDKTIKELVLVELDGKEAIMFRMLRKLCDPAKKHKMLHSIIELGLHEHLGAIRSVMLHELIGGLFHKGDEHGEGEEGDKS